MPASSCRLLWFSVLLNKLFSLFTIIQEGKTLKAKCYNSAKVTGQKITKILLSKVVDNYAFNSEVVDNYAFNSQVVDNYAVNSQVVDNYAFKHLLHISNSPTVDGADRSYIQE